MLQTIFSSYGGKVPQGAEIIGIYAFVDTPKPTLCRVVSNCLFPWVEVRLVGHKETTFVPSFDLYQVQTCVEVAG